MSTEKFNPVEYTDPKDILRDYVTLYEDVDTEEEKQEVVESMNDSITGWFLENE